MIIQTRGTRYEAHIAGKPEVKEHGFAYPLDLVRVNGYQRQRKTLIVALEGGSQINLEQYDLLQNVLKILDVFIEQCFIQSANSTSKSSLAVSLALMNNMAESLSNSNGLPKIGVSLV